MKKPIIWLPTIISSAIVAPILVLTLSTQTTPYGAGMGTAGLVGPLQTLSKMGYSIEAWLSIGLTFVLGGFLVFVIDMFMRKKEMIIKGDLDILNDIV